MLSRLLSCSKCCICHFQDPICVCNIQDMESETEDKEIIVMYAWSVSEYCHSSDDLYISESRDGSYYEERKSDTELPIDLQHTQIRQTESPHSVESPEPYTKKAMVEHQRPPSDYSPEECSPVRGLSPSRS